MPFGYAQGSEEKQNERLHLYFIMLCAIQPNDTLDYD